jgi:hypothetical protein
VAWNFNSALSDPLITVANQIDDWGIFEIQLGSIPTIITISLGRHMNSDETKVWLSHVIHTPVQLGPYKTSRAYWDDPEYALQQTISAFTQYYQEAVKKGQTPDASWLVKT